MLVIKRQYKVEFDDRFDVLVKNTKFYINRSSKGYPRVRLFNGKPFASIFFPQYNSVIHEIDHIDGNVFNNQISNLRLCSHAENAFNKKLSINNKSGFKGVRWEKDKKLWESCCRARGVAYRKRFKNKRDAIVFYNEMATLHHGRFAHLSKVPNVLR